jgi:hypothetical protein
MYVMPYASIIKAGRSRGLISIFSFQRHVLYIQGDSKWKNRLYVEFRGGNKEVWDFEATLYVDM